MARPTRSPFENNPIRKRLAALRRRLRLVTTVRGTGFLLALLLLTAMQAGVLDWFCQLPALVRACFLVYLLVAAGVVALQALVRPLFSKMDDLTLALKVEERYPSLNDALASTVQFLEQAERNILARESASASPVATRPDGGGPGSGDSPALRREAVRRTVQKAEGCDFNRVVDSRDLGVSVTLGGVAALATVALVFFFPAVAGTALARLVDPFGPHPWPSQTRLEMGPHKDRIGRNDAFEIRGRVFGVIPDEAVIVYRLDGGSNVEHRCRITRDDSESPGRVGTGSGHFATMLRPSQLQRRFRFFVR